VAITGVIVYIIDSALLTLSTLKSIYMKVKNIVLPLCILVQSPTLLEAQCAICRAVLRKRRRVKVTAEGINDGIVLLNGYSLPS